MGHLAGKEDILKGFPKRLHQNPIGLHEHTTVYEILSVLFSETEAEVGEKFPFGLVTFEETQKGIGIEYKKLEGILKGMIKMELIITSVKNGKAKYMFSPGVTGFFEFTFKRTHESLPMKELAELMHIYKNPPEFIKEFFSAETSRGRTYINDNLPSVRSEVLRFDEGVEHIERAE